METYEIYFNEHDSTRIIINLSIDEFRDLINTARKNNELLTLNEERSKGSLYEKNILIDPFKIAYIRKLK